jgi:hypothetical protein
MTPRIWPKTTSDALKKQTCLRPFQFCFASTTFRSVSTTWRSCARPSRGPLDVTLDCCGRQPMFILDANFSHVLDGISHCNVRAGAIREGCEKESKRPIITTPTPHRHRPVWVTSLNDLTGRRSAVALHSADGFVKVKRPSRRSGRPLSYYKLKARCAALASWIDACPLTFFCGLKV